MQRSEFAGQESFVGSRMKYSYEGKGPCYGKCGGAHQGLEPQTGTIPSHHKGIKN